MNENPSEENVRQPFEADSAPNDPDRQAGKPNVRQPFEADTSATNSANQAAKPNVRQPFQADASATNSANQAAKPDLRKPTQSRTNYHRHLPHQIPPNTPIFLTWNLKGSLPKNILDMLDRERTRLESSPVLPNETRQDRAVRHSKILFAKRDDYLDTCRDGPMWLAEPIASMEVIASILWGVPDRYHLYAWCVLSNHVHVLLKPTIELKKITQGIKGYTAYQINGLQNQRDRVFWQDESYDHWCRDEEEFYRIIAYIENNPVKANLCVSPDQWRWSSAYVRARIGWKTGEALSPECKSEILELMKSS